MVFNELSSFKGECRFFVKKKSLIIYCWYSYIFFYFLDYFFWLLGDYDYFVYFDFCKFGVMIEFFFLLFFV